ncbi:MAG TPA: methyltransferase [Candidatus Saccharimonadales bacterium]|nr:methyltransferase [Candidatus Saccharimonadales bacterium]
MAKPHGSDRPVWQEQYLSSVLLAWLSLALFQFGPYYSDFLSRPTKLSLLLLVVSYTVTAPFAYALIPRRDISYSKAYITLRMLRRVSGLLFEYLRRFPVKTEAKLLKISETERVAGLFIVVKLFFLPLMLNFLFINYHSLQSDFQSLQSVSSLMTADVFNSIVYPLLFTLFIFIDTVVFTFGYTVEGRIFRNRVRSVEPTFLGWFVALVSYPPFSGFVGGYLVWYANDFVVFSSQAITAVVHIVLLILIAVYASASVALGPKASNLTNRGIVNYGPYRFVRHPAYICKTLIWWITIIPVLSLAAVFSMAVWTCIYFLRAITEERHLIRDPDYQAYCIKVKYRFIPGLV